MTTLLVFMLLTVHAAPYTGHHINYIAPAHAVTFTYITPVTDQALPYQQEEEIDDPVLITEEEAKIFFKYYGMRELFFGDVPHERALMMDQEIRRRNGLEGVRLGSNRPESPFYRWKRANGIQRRRRQ
ncbi:unnamed protein product [Timema podura]|uniref:Uncharacterized protein n=1 Tax=Timema podura TaxID=61482 RepID=A0ABN7NTS8_TIMPD|nr:unnamed protein product [Timema podura]